MTPRPRYALGYLDDRRKPWLVLRGTSRTAPLFTDEPRLAWDWETPADVAAWLDAVPDLVRAKVKGEWAEVPGGRAWTTGKNLRVYPVTTTLGDSIHLHLDPTRPGRTDAR